MFANSAVALGGGGGGGGRHLVRRGQVLALGQGILGVLPFCQGDGALFSYFLSVSNFSIHRSRVRNWSKLVEQGCTLLDSMDYMGIPA